MTLALGFARPIRDGGVRWAVEGQFPQIGRLSDAPGELGSWLAEDRLRSVLVEANGLMVWPGRAAPQDWAQSAQDVIAEALPLADQWQVEPAADGLLWTVADDVINGELASYIASHGGEVELIAAENGQLDLRLGGHCVDCSAKEVTMYARIRGAVSARVGYRVEINDQTPKGRGLSWPIFGRR